MARTATLGVAGFLLSVVFVLASLWWIPDSARAATTPLPPGPVDEIADIPARVLRSATGSPVGDSIVGDYLKAQQALIALKRAADAGELATATLAPKPITAPAALARGSGSVLTAVMAAWAIGSNGTLALVGVANGSDYESTFCAQPSWYQATTSFVNMGFAPDCTVAPPVINPDVTPGMFLNYGGANVVFTGWKWNDPGTATACFTGDDTLDVGGWAWRSTPGGSWNMYANYLPAYSGNCPGRYVYTTAPETLSVYNGQLPSGQPNIVATIKQADGDPFRTPRCRIEWENGAVTTGTGSQYRESAGVPLSSAGLGCEQAYTSQPGRGPDLLPRRISVGSTNDDTGVITEISDQDVPEFGPDERKAFAPGNGRGLVLEKVTGLTVRSCMTWEADCSGWWDATSAGTSPTVGTDTFRCTYAGATIALAECGAYRHTFDVQTQTPTITDPATGNEIPWSAGSPSWATVNPTVTGGGACGAAWSWNPVDWVLNPLKCAFVPSSAAVQTATGQVEDAWQDSWPVKAMQAGTASLTAIQGVSLDGCSGPHVYFELTWPAAIVFDAYPLNACGPPYDFLAMVARTLGSLLLIGYTAWGVTRRVGAVVTAPGVGPA